MGRGLTKEDFKLPGNNTKLDLSTKWDFGNVADAGPVSAPSLKVH